MLGRRGALSLPGRECLWRGTACDGDHPFIRLRNTGGAHVARLKRDAHLQGPAVSVFSTGHEALLAAVASGSPRVAASGAEPPETRPHSWGAVVSVACSSRTLPKSWQLCRKCSLPCAGQYMPPSWVGCMVRTRGTATDERPMLLDALC